MRLPLSLRKNIGQPGFSVKVEATLAGGIELLPELLWSGEAPGGFESAAQRRPPGGFQADAGGPAATPSTVAGVEDSGLGFDKHLLFDGREFDHSPAILWVAESGKDLSGDAKIGVIHVGVLGRFGEAQGKAAKILGGHGSALLC